MKGRRTGRYPLLGILSSKGAFDLKKGKKKKGFSEKRIQNAGKKTSNGQKSTFKGIKMGSARRG